MITFDSLTLKAFVQENKSWLSGAKIQKIQQPTRRDLIFSIRKLGESKKLYINISPQLYHICFMRKENEAKRRIEIPKKPPMFCMLLRKYLENAQISDVAQPQNERIFELHIQTNNELEENIYLCLAVELMGKHSNVILYNKTTGIIIGCAHNVGAEKSRERELAGTLPYIYPPKQSKIDLLNYNGKIDYNTLSNDFYMFSSHFGKLCGGQNLESLKNYVMLKTLTPVISNDYSQFCLFKELLPDSIIKNSVNEMIDDYFAYYQETEKFKSLKNHFLTLCNQRLKRTNNSIDKMKNQIAKEADCDKYRLYGDLIMANLYSNKDYSEKIQVFDYENNREIVIDLDETKTLKDNAAKFYKLYNKGKTSKLKLTELSQSLEQTREYLEQLKYSIVSSKTYEDLIEIKSEITDTENTKTEAHKATEPEKIIEGDYTIYIGKNNRQNDYIVSKLSKDEDLWFHTKDCAGSHVLLKGENPADEMILKCAKLAKEYSSASNSSKVGIIYTKRKYLKKPPKTNLGYVTYRNEKEIVV